ncbi:TPA: 2-oxo acid dehydrogenase subunit E2 [archaeon]|uniref:2-oxo acid dehydrogenase subunit E2 n=1 Tax=Candidatus Naiadarchaeum limnaeum TaxID=2756139 RepID=A0A832V2B7_9ARCH|nr:2-oxo acid dehydrogenase subunit E2 [Candidatus Naiadarchaeum limnaeum]
MAKEFKFPDVGEGIHEGVLVKWLVKEGDKISEHQNVAEIETDKAVVEMPSPFGGVVLKLNFKQGDTVRVGEVLMVVGEAGEKYTPGAAKEERKAPAPQKKEEKFFGVIGEIAVSDRVIPPAPETVQATPVVRALAKQLNVDINKVKGTGQGSRITEEDVRQASSVKPQAAPAIRHKYDMYGHLERLPLKGVRKIIAEKMVESFYTAPPVTVMDEADVTELSKVRETAKAQAQKKGIHITYMPYIMKALLAAFKEYPNLNASLDTQFNEIIVKLYFNFGVAVDTEEGLIVPVVKGVNTKSVEEIAKEVAELSEKARSRKIDLADLRGGTFTITNYGSIGTQFGTPIINYPESAILGLGRIQEKPVVKDGKIVVRKMLPISLTFDHRIVDGAYAARFITVLIKNLENPELLLKQ